MSQNSMAAFILAAALVMHLPATSSADPAGALSEEFLSELRDGYEMNDADRGRHNAISNNDIDKLALNREIVRGEDGHFTHLVNTKGIPDPQIAR
jgi:bleomycin hydrolase